MKKHLLSLLALCLLGMGSAFAQSEIVVGDMDGSGDLTVGDVTALTDAVLHPEKVRTISTKCDANVSDPSAIAGSWRALDKSTLELTADGKATVSVNSAVTEFEYFPYRGDLVLLNAGGYVVQDYHVLRLSKDYVVFRLIDGTYATYYPSDRYATALSLSCNSLSLRHGETHQLSVEPTPAGTITPVVTWESSNSAVATVSADGLVTAVNDGSCTISARATDGSWEATCNITVAQPVESITLNYTRLMLDLYGERQLIANVLPKDASDLTYIWTSSDGGVAVVNPNGIVRTTGYGRCTITATANDGSGVKAECVIYVHTMHYGRAYVDLGLPSGTLWAACNVGANFPADYGDLFAWGEVDTKSVYDWSTYLDSTDGTKDSFYKYYDYKVKPELDLEDDVAYRKWGEGWRMPSDDQFTELREKCTWTWTKENDINGYNVVGPNGNYIFLPAAGCYRDDSSGNVGSTGNYWSRTHSWYPYASSDIYFNSTYVKKTNTNRFFGQSVRPVLDESMHPSPYASHLMP